MDPYNERFGGLARLYSASGLERLRCAHVCVVGVGGVGSWAVEALARSGVGALTLVDLDDVCVRNVNRQIHALDGELGKPKVEVLARRIQAINPACRVDARQAFFVKSNAEELLAPGYSAVLDAIDSPSLKAFLIGSCRERGLPVVTTGAAGGRRDPTAIKVADLSESSNDRLLFQVRRLLRRHHAFPQPGERFGVECVLSREPVVYPGDDGSVCAARPGDPDLRLDCETGYGTACFVTGAFGLVAASRIVAAITGEGRSGPGVGRWETNGAKSEPGR